MAWLLGTVERWKSVLGDCRDKGVAVVATLGVTARPIESDHIFKLVSCHVAMSPLYRERRLGCQQEVLYMIVLRGTRQDSTFSCPIVR